MKRFTLLEMMVVIIIIALLASFLLPSLARAKYKSKLVSCMSNQKNQSIAYISYAKDNSGKYPTRIDEGYWPFGNLDGGIGDTVARGPAMLYEGNYLTDGTLFYCPVRTGFWIKEDKHWNPDNWAKTWIEYSYWVNYDKSSTDDVALDVTSNADTIITSDLTGTVSGDFKRSAHMYQNKFMSSNHLFNDGHVETLLLDDLELKFNYGGMDFYY